MSVRRLEAPTLSKKKKTALNHDGGPVIAFLGCL